MYLNEFIAFSKSLQKTIMTDCSSFELFRRGDCVYIDKTSYIAKLVGRHKISSYFVSRPRKFGKTLFLDTLEWFFKGDKEAFKGLAIYDDSSVIWEEFPVIRFDMSALTGNTSTTDLESTLKRMVQPGVYENVNKF